MKQASWQNPQRRGNGYLRQWMRPARRSVGVRAGRWSRRRPMTVTCGGTRRHMPGVTGYALPSASRC